MDIKTLWTFDPAYDEQTRDRLERTLYPEVADWVVCNYPLALVQLEHTPLAKSAGQHKGAKTPFVVAGEAAWMSVWLNVCRTIPTDCWICVGSYEFVRATCDKYMQTWEQWNREQKHRAVALKLESPS